MSAPADFTIINHGEVSEVERHFALPNGDSLSFKIKVNVGKGRDVTIMELHRQSTDAAIRYLLTLLPEGYGESPYQPGPKK